MLSSRSMGYHWASNPMIDLEMVFDVTETTGSIYEIDAIARYSASFPLSSIHAELLDRNVGARSELLINGVRAGVNLDASLGTAIKINMDVPEEYRDLRKSLWNP